MIILITKNNMKIHVKFYNRSLGLYAVQYWYRGGHFEIKKHFGVHHTPLFHYKKGRATSVYFEKHQPKKVSNKIINHFSNNPEAFEIGIEEYRKIHKEGLRAVEQKDPKKIFSAAVKMWPMLNAMMLMGEIESDDLVLKRLKDMSAKARAETDQLVYAIGNGLWDSIDSSIPEEDRSFLTIEEIINKDIPPPEEIEHRKRGYVYTHDTLVLDDDIPEFLKKHSILFEDDEIIEDVNEFSGNTAYGGKITGKVRVVLEYRDMKKFEEGEILVSSMTIPDFLPVMKKASAFITDEGGITCHAAIIAREMKKPCIIGTKIATQVLKDGDIVEVDADNGMVRKIYT